jgi:hypothetical protein
MYLLVQEVFGSEISLRLVHDWKDWKTMISSY